MRKLLWLAIICVNSIVLHAQTDSMIVSATYAFKHLDDTTQPDFPATSTMRLYIGKQLSCYTNHPRIKAVIAMLTERRTPGLDDSWIRQDLLVGSILKDLQRDLLIDIPHAGLNHYMIEEKMPVIKWEVLPETKDIKGYPCQKATCSFRGRDYEAWFCAQLPFSNGPWKLGGLPGLILEAYDTKKDVMFNFISFDNAVDIASFTVPTHYEKITAKAYRQYIDASNKDTNAMLGASNASGVTIYKGVSSTGSGTSQRRWKILNNPLEKTNN